MMERFRLKNGRLCPPPRNAVTSEGEVISNFDMLIAGDAGFAAKNRYFPRAAGVPLAPPIDSEEPYVLENGEWVLAPQPLALPDVGACD